MRFKTWFKENVMRFIPTKLWVEMDYYTHFHKKCNLKNPATYNEKLNWLKVYYHDSSRSRIVDKYAVRQYISEKIGEGYLIPLLGKWDSFDEIDFDSLPDKFVLKPNHTSGNVFICTNKADINMDELRSTVNGWLKRRYFRQGREWEYKAIKPCIIAEELMVDESGTELKDYKFFCFDGEPKILFIATDRSTEVKFDFFDINFNHLPIKNGHKNSDKPIPKPDKFDEMVQLARKLSVGMPHVRVDLYNINGKIYFGELTFYHFGAAVPFDPPEWDEKFGEWLTLPERKSK